MLHFILFILRCVSIPKAGTEIGAIEKRTALVVFIPQAHKRRRGHEFGQIWRWSLILVIFFFYLDKPITLSLRRALNIESSNIRISIMSEVKYCCIMAMHNAHCTIIAIVSTSKRCGGPNTTHINPDRFDSPSRMFNAQIDLDRHCRRRPFKLNAILQ